MPAETTRTDASAFVWREKYRAAGERKVADTWARVARAVASVEAAPDAWELAFRRLLQDFRFLPGGRILAGAGASEPGTLNNCFVMGPIEDSEEGVFRALRECVTTLASGGGVGLDFSTLRPRGGRMSGGVPAPGPVAMLGLWEAACAAFLGGSSRPGAMMATLRCDHPDIAAFIDAKRRPAALAHFNLSVQITDAFMAAVGARADWPLVHGGRVWRTAPAASLWEELARSAHACGEPGILFIDRINAANNLWWRETITAANPCGEVPLPAYGACVLGSLNLTAFVDRPFEPGASFDLQALAHAARLAVRFLDDVIDLTAYPLPQQAEAARATRRVGLGVTGLADALVVLGGGYGEPRSRELAAEAVRTVRDAAYRSSAELAAEKGAFPLFDAGPYLEAPFIRNLPEDIRRSIRVCGVRNSHLLAIAPTGSISLLAGGVSTGVEPIFAARQKRLVRDGAGRPQAIVIEDPALKLWRARGGAGAPPGWVTAQDLPVAGHLQMQAALQPFVDGAISKTVNAPADCSWETFRDMFEGAYRLGLKGCTGFRPSRLREGVLQAERPVACRTVQPCD